MPKEREHCLSEKDRLILYGEFFTTKEIKAFDKMLTPDGQTLQVFSIRDPLWKSMRSRRIEDASRLLKKGLTPNQIRRHYNDYFKDKDAKPADFLKMEYDILKKGKKKTKDYKATVTKAIARINKHLGGAYTKAMPKQSRYTPVRKPIPMKASRKGDIYQ